MNNDHKQKIIVIIIIIFFLFLYDYQIIIDNLNSNVRKSEEIHQQTHLSHIPSLFDSVWISFYLVCFGDFRPYCETPKILQRNLQNDCGWGRGKECYKTNQ